MAEVDAITGSRVYPAVVANVLGTLPRVCGIADVAKIKPNIAWDENDDGINQIRVDLVQAVASGLSTGANHYHAGPVTHDPVLIAHGNHRATNIGHGTYFTRAVAASSDLIDNSLHRVI